MTLCKAFKALGKELTSEVGEVADNNPDVAQQDGAEEGASTKKPFRRYFEERLCRVKASCDEQFRCNAYFKPEFPQALHDKWLPTCTFWSSLLRGIWFIIV